MTFFQRFIVLFLLGSIQAQSQSVSSKIQIFFDGAHMQANLSTGNEIRKFVLFTRIPSTQEDNKEELVYADNLKIITRQKIRHFENACILTNTLQKTTYGLRWDIEILGAGEDWTEPVETSLQWENPNGIQFWTTWSNNHQHPQNQDWQDPFLPAPFQNLRLVYGGENHGSPDAFVIPMATSLINNENIGLSLVQSLEDSILDLEMRTDPNGLIAMRHLHHRISESRKIRFTYHIVLHEADWRAALSWICKQYPEYFLPKEPQAKKWTGGGAYSSYEGDLDSAKFRKMGLGLNWKASLDFPYMGLFIPPMKSDQDYWEKYRQGGVQVGDGYASINRLNAYSEKLLRLGFHTISYFNVNEFGNGIQYPYRLSAIGEEDWKNPNQYVYTKLKAAMLQPAGTLPPWEERPLYSNWEGSIVLDPGDSTYQNFLLNQAKLHIQKIPSSAGICIDRLDWLRFFNSKADDGVSMVQNQKTRSLVLSWKDLMGKLGPIMHQAHKVIFCNPLDRRIDLMKEIDGIYDEFGYLPSSLNACAQMALMKPIISWTVSMDNFKPDPDRYFQHHLYMGAFLTIPYPGNDHCILPDPKAEQFYLDYAPLFEAIKGRDWLLIPHVVELDGDLALANIFQVNKKIMIPVVLGGTHSQAQLTIRLPYSVLNKAVYQVKLLFPGESQWTEAGTLAYQDRIQLNCPMKRGCVLVCLE